MVKSTKTPVVQANAKARTVSQEQLPAQGTLWRESSWEDDLRRNGISFPSNWTIPGMVPGVREVSGEHKR